MNPYDGLSKEEFEETFDPEYHKKWPTECQTLCKDNTRAELANMYITKKNVVNSLQTQVDDYYKRKNVMRTELHDEQIKNRLLRKEIDELNNRLISYRLSAFVAKIFSKIGYVRK